MAARLKKENLKRDDLWGLSSAGRAPALQAGGREFESLSLHDGNEQCSVVNLLCRFTTERKLTVRACTETGRNLSVHSANARDEIAAEQL